MLSSFVLLNIFVKTMTIFPGFFAEYRVWNKSISLKYKYFLYFMLYFLYFNDTEGMLDE